MFKLVIQDDEGKTTVVPLIRDEITIGRKEGNTIRLTERNVSRRHARILRNNGEVQIEDLGSYNGIRVNNARIAERVSLRLSDQVQIGDYKLYLKAEGVEQVDDARTMPIERIENGAATTEAVPAVQPPSITPAVQTIPAAPPMQQARAVAVADTDPAGRPVATPAQVAALSSTVGYGKLVVVSSNFAGKEFDLTRPQMIVGRTDENDIVVNHRSISRNHAKVTRDPETQRYTISDLQSSNGVRVNGQDYGKVELRRGDVVDLGHVRLRFVEPNEDFVFSRDAVLSDVAESGGKKGLLVAVLLAIVVLGAAAAFFAFRGGSTSDKPTNGGGAGNTMVDNHGTGSAVAANGAGSNGSAGFDIGSNVAVEPALEAGVAATVDNGSAELKQLSSECLQYVTERKWEDVRLCAEKLAPLDKKQSDGLLKRSREESVADLTKGKMEDEIRAGSLTKAKKLLDQINDDSSYKKEAQTEYDNLESRTIEDYKSRAQGFKRDKKCADIDKLLTQAAGQGNRVVDAVRAFKCDAVAVVTDCASTLHDARDRKCLVQFCGGHGDDPHCPGATSAPTASCDPDALREAGTQSEALGQHAQAVTQFEAALRCRPDTHTIELAFMAACNAGNVGKAKIYYKKLSAEQQSKVVVMCIRSHITKEQLDAP